jgi:PAS domain S-box-containing protein
MKRLTDNSVENRMYEEHLSHLAAIVEFSEDAIISKSTEGVIKSWNKGSEKIFGYTSKETIGKNISFLFTADSADQEKKVLQRILNNEIIESYETVRLKKNGERVDISLTVYPLKDNTGKIIGISSIGRDYTLRKKSEATLIAANKELEFQNAEKEKRATELITINNELIAAQISLKEVNAELEAFTYSVSHDLRAPLRAINSYSQILIEDYGSVIGDDGNEILQNINYNSKKMGALIDELLSFSRLGRKEIDRIEIDINKMIKSNVLKEINQTIKHNASIKVGPMPMVKADHTLLHQVLFNLLSNAIKYSSKKENPEVEIYAEQQNNKTVFAIKDNGAGFDMRFVHKLFGVFQRLHSEKEFEGNGVGLAIAQRIIFKHGGRIWAEGTVNEGATFYFTLN